MHQCKECGLGLYFYVRLIDSKDRNVFQEHLNKSSPGKRGPSISLMLQRLDSRFRGNDRRDQTNLNCFLIISFFAFFASLR